MFVLPHVNFDNPQRSAETVPEIPSESSVVAAREKRERLRQQKKQTSGEEEFISLTVARREDTYQGPHPESRLVREEDELGEGDDGIRFLHLPMNVSN